MWYCLNCHHVFDSPKYHKDMLVTDPYPDDPMISVCPYCHSDEFVKAIQCDCCGEYHPSEMTYWIDADCESVCDDCFSDYYGTCEDCGEHYKLKDLEDHNGNLLCPSCLEDAIEKESEMEEAV